MKSLLQELRELNRNNQEMRWEVRRDINGHRYVWLKEPVHSYYCTHNLRSDNGYGLPSGLNIDTETQICGFCHTKI